MVHLEQHCFALSSAQTNKLTITGGLSTGLERHWYRVVGVTALRSLGSQAGALETGIHKVSTCVQPAGLDVLL